MTSGRPCAQCREEGGLEPPLLLLLRLPDPGARPRLLEHAEPRAPHICAHARRGLHDWQHPASSAADGHVGSQRRGRPNDVEQCSHGQVVRRVLLVGQARAVDLAQRRGLLAQHRRGAQGTASPDVVQGVDPTAVHDGGCVVGDAGEAGLRQRSGQLRARCERGVEVTADDAAPRASRSEAAQRRAELPHSLRLVLGRQARLQVHVDHTQLAAVGQGEANDEDSAAVLGPSQAEPASLEEDGVHHGEAAAVLHHGGEAGLGQGLLEGAQHRGPVHLLKAEDVAGGEARQPTAEERQALLCPRQLASEAIGVVVLLREQVPREHRELARATTGEVAPRVQRRAHCPSHARGPQRRAPKGAGQVFGEGGKRRRTA
mmetsp:Transcript_99295/g.222541  ORF Transcript_99295/g.222541 Transcript_99295/m.222541 type:complete len:373 (-) Transcript_99295:14-1132(-)